MIEYSEELIIRESLANTVAAAMTESRVIPAPSYFVDPSEYWSSYDFVDLETQEELEAAQVSCCWVYLKRITDDLEQPADSPQITLVYELYIFSQYDAERSDESVVTPDAFNRLMLRRHNEFIKNILSLKGSLQGVRNLGLLDTVKYTEQKTNSIVQTQDIINRGPCEFIPMVKGHSVRFEESVLLRLKEC